MGPQKETTVPKHTDAEPVVEGAESRLAPPLPDLSGVDLRTLRRMDNPALAAAVAHILHGPGERGELFAQNPGSGNGNGNGNGKAGRCGG